MKRLFSLVMCLAYALSLSACSAAPLEPIRRLTIVAPEGPVANILTNLDPADKEQITRVVWPKNLYEPKIEAALLSGQSDYDLIFLPAHTVARWAAIHAIQPISSDAFPTMAQVWINAVQYQGQTWAIPAQPDMHVLFYRQDWFAAQHIAPPTSWDEWIAAAQQLTDPPQHDGLVLATAPFRLVDTFQDFAVMQKVPASTYIRPDLELQQVSAVREFASFLHSPVLSLAAEQFDYDQVAEALRSGKAAMGILPLSYAPALLSCQQAPPNAACQQGHSTLQVTSLPGMSPGTVTGDLGVWVIPRNARSVDQAVQWIARSTSPTESSRWIQAGGLPTLPTASLPAEIRAHSPYLAVLDGAQVYQPLFPLSTTTKEWHDTFLKMLHNSIQDPERIAAILHAWVDQAVIIAHTDWNYEVKP